MTHIKVVSYNCRGLPKNRTALHMRPDILSLFQKYDVIFFQETWLAKQELNACNSLHENFLACGVACVDFSAGILHGRPYGGVSVFYHKRLANFISPIYFLDCNWCVGVNIAVESTPFTLLNTYLPFECIDNTDDYIEKLTLLESFIENISHASFALVGDFNANVSSGSSKFAEYVINFCSRNSLIFSSKRLLPSDTYTYISERWGSTSWLDHLIASPDFHNCIRHITVEYDVTVCDHIPFTFFIEVSMLPATISENSSYSSITNKTCWKSFSDNECEIYSTFTDIYCHSEKLKHSLPLCNDCNCNSNHHHDMLTKSYTCLIESLILSAQKTKSSVRKSDNRQPGTGKPGWSNYVKHKHNVAIDAYKVWRDNGKPHHGPFHDNHRKSKLNYKYAIRTIKRNIEKIKADNVACKLSNNDYTGFWDAVKNLIVVSTYFLRKWV